LSPENNLWKCFRHSPIFTSYLEDIFFNIYIFYLFLYKRKWLPTPSLLPFVSIDLLTPPPRFAIWSSYSEQTFHRSSCHPSKLTLLCCLHCLCLKNSQKIFTIIIFPPYNRNQTNTAINTDFLRSSSYRFLFS